MFWELDENNFKRDQRNTKTNFNHLSTSQNKLLFCFSTLNMLNLNIFILFYFFTFFLGVFWVFGHVICCLQSILENFWPLFFFQYFFLLLWNFNYLHIRLFDSILLFLVDAFFPLSHYFFFLFPVDLSSSSVINSLENLKSADEFIENILHFCYRAFNF